MARAGLRITGGRNANGCLVEQPYYLKPCPGNPYIGTQFDKTPHSTGGGYRKGFIFKPIHHLYRFRYNLWPVGQTTGYYSGNKFAKHIHWLEVSTMERVRVQAFGEEAVPIFWLSMCVFSFTAFHLFRLCNEHADGTAYLFVGPFSKKFVKMTRFSEPWPMDKPVPYRLFQRTPEWTTYDAYRELMKLEIAANDPFIEQLRDEGRLEAVKYPPKHYVGAQWITKVGPWGNADPPTRPYSTDGSIPYKSFLDIGPYMGEVKTWQWKDKFHEKLSYVGGHVLPK